MQVKTTAPYFLIGLIAAALALTLFIVRPFLVILVFAAIFAVVLQPLYRRILGRMQASPGLAAFVTMLISVVCILTPLAFIMTQIAGDTQNLYVSLSSGGGKAYLDSAVRAANDAAAHYVPSVAMSDAALSVSVDQYMKNVLTWVVQNLADVFGSVLQMLLNLSIFGIALYYLLRDGARFKREIIGMSPLSDADDEIIFSRLAVAINSVIRGSLTIAIIQGILTGFGFFVFGVPNSVLWGVVAMLAALIPAIGTSLVLVPGVIYLFATGATVPAIGLLVWSLIAVGLIDNFLGPRLVGKGMQLHPLVIFLAVFGGLAFFGPAGLFLGPLCVSLLFSLLSIYPHIARQTVNGQGDQPAV